MQDMKIQQITHHGLYIMDARVAELHHLVALGTYYVVVLAIAVRFLVLRQVTAKLVLAYQVVLYQQIQGIVNCCAAHLIVLVFHADVKRLYIKVAVAGVYLLQDGISLGCFAQAFALEIGREYFLYFLKLNYV